ncbi:MULTISPECIES: dTMP kinase [Bacillus]|uniref:Thymidylate kinase n=2 Tax=Bacillus thuringiensis TaxID=1428 RepID=A0A9X6Z561_BACTU|nr:MULTISPECIES: dTMP kinase [Bacillus]MCU5280662.1 dTMP kinase [Bacillus cereus]AFV22034.1 thymidylate kinase Tmk [Bacillus thuringiensis Bt407]EEM24947.1 Thymidylate kinase [Bacillus thuringiensis Bt407]ERI00789.1 Thymidylate kinase [Bacillus thuringiensis T01-328]MBN6707571.1 dTMP kinase [Bacillus thuringiensis]
MRTRGLFVSIEGGEGSGKSALIQGLSLYLEEQGMECLTSREPGGVKVAEEIRELIMENEMDAITEALLFASARREHFKNKISPALTEGKIVICDRFVDSSIVYQGYVQGIGMDNVLSINSQALEGLVMPHLTLYLDVEPTIALNRIAQNNRETNRFDEKSIEFHKKVREGYLLIEEKHSNRIKKVDASLSKDEVLQQSIEYIKNIL